MPMSNSLGKYDLTLRVLIGVLLIGVFLIGVYLWHRYFLSILFILFKILLS